MSISAVLYNLTCYIIQYVIDQGYEGNDRSSENMQMC